MAETPSPTPNGYPPLPETSRIGRLFRLIRKELSEILRDRRTMLTLFLMPVLLYPLLGIVFYQILEGDKLGKVLIPQYRLGFVSEEQKESLARLLFGGQQRLNKSGRTFAIDPKKPDDVTNRSPHQIIEASVALSEDYTEDLEKAVREGKIDLGLKFTGDRQSIDLREPRLFRATIEMYYRVDSQTGRDAVRYVQQLIDSANLGFRGFQIRSVVRPPPRRKREWWDHTEPVSTKVTEVQNPDSKRTSWLAALVPLILILMTITGAVYPAIDLTAGERERGTLEMLIAAPIPRMSLLLAKYVTVLIVALLTALMNIVPMLVTLVATGLAKELYSAGGWLMLAIQLVQVFALLMLFTAFFAAVLLALTSFARSFKEAQAYLVPLMLVALTPGILSLLPGLELRGVLAFVPLMNIVLLARDLLDGSVDWAMGLLVVSMTCLYAVLAIMLAARVFGTEAVVARSPGRWRRLFGLGTETPSAGES